MMLRVDIKAMHECSQPLALLLGLQQLRIALHLLAHLPQAARSTLFIRLHLLRADR
ncbi:hypothetical protein D3C79_906540 [compost metagenome]